MEGSSRKNSVYHQSYNRRRCVETLKIYATTPKSAWDTIFFIKKKFTYKILKES
jgi:hypothetical protein